jgi:uncharacterized membrane-anchored protein YhcB (DUF1043 family)
MPFYLIGMVIGTAIGYLAARIIHSPKRDARGRFTK